VVELIDGREMSMLADRALLSSFTSVPEKSRIEEEGQLLEFILLYMSAQIGREFDHRLLKSISGIRGDL
jgi:hypothetical protein